jgi:hypothetical protein
MEPGFIVDASGDTVNPSEWVAGPPRRSWLTGTRLRGKLRMPLPVRCGECCSVRLYAVTLDAAAAAPSKLAAPVDPLETELARLGEPEHFLMYLLQDQRALGAPVTDDHGDESMPGDV